ncbi:MAG: transporter substrate-binding domain-containing protein [Clostridia bacterium]|nr:transporter substrate-binding domain-containing protein [Clostridia bacterium]
MRKTHSQKNTKGFMDRKGRRHRLNSFLRDTDPKLLRRGIFAILALIVIVIILFAQNTEPQLLNTEEITAVREKGVLTVGVLDEIPLFSDDGEGLEIELAMLLAEKILPEMTGGAGVSFYNVTTTSISSHLSDGTIDVAIALMKKGQDANCVYSDAYYTDKIGLAVLTGQKHMGFKNTTIGYVFEGKKMAIPEELSEFAKKNNANLKAYAGYDDMLRDLTLKKIDACLMYGVYANKYKAEYTFELSETTLGYVEYAIATSKNTPAFAEISNIMLKEIKENGKLSALLP